MIKAEYNRIKVVLVEKKKTQAELAEELNKGRVTVNRYCNNELQPSLETLFKIASFLEVDVCDLLQKG